MKNILFLMPFLLLACSPLKKTNSGLKDMTYETYYVKKNDNTVKEGAYTQSYQGFVITQGNYTAGKRSGLWHFYDVSGKVNFSGSYKDDKKNGKWTYYNYKALSAEVYYTNGLADSALAYHDSGQLAYEMRLDQQKSGHVRSYYRNGQLKDFFLVKERRMDGLYQLYFENGQLHRETEYKADRAMSSLKTYDAKGKPINGGTLKNGEGSLVEYFLPQTLSDSLVKFQVTGYSDGILNGEARVYYKSGRLQEQGHYKDGYRSGDWQLYKEDGSFNASVNYSDSTHELSRSQYSGLLYFSESDYERDESKMDFQGGEAARAKFIVNTVKYPGYAREHNIEGKVFIYFVISETGELLRYRLTKKVHPLLDEEVVRVVKSMPRWNPSLYSGIPMRTSFSMPISFRLK